MNFVNFFRNDDGISSIKWTNFAWSDEPKDSEEEGFLRSHLNYGNELKINL